MVSFLLYSIPNYLQMQKQITNISHESTYEAALLKSRRVNQINSQLCQEHGKVQFVTSA